MPKIIYRDNEWEVSTNITVRDAIKKGGLNPETVLATRDGRLITEDVHLKAEDVVKLVTLGITVLGVILAPLGVMFLVNLLGM